MSASTPSDWNEIWTFAKVRFGCELGLQQKEYLVWIAEELLRWNKTHNLTGHREIGQVMENMILDSLAMMPWTVGADLLDIGSGAGFPGLALAVALPHLKLLSLEPRAKRVSFQRHVVRNIGLGARVEVVEGVAGKGHVAGRAFSMVTARAVGDLEDTLGLARLHLAPQGTIIMPRGISDRSVCLRMGFQVVEYQLIKPKSQRILVIVKG